MTRRILSLLLLVGCGHAAAPAAAQSMRLGQPNAARFPQVTLYSYPMDARGVLIADLSTDNFRVSENGQPARVLRVEAREGSLDVCLALDRSRSMATGGKMDYAKTAAREFLRQLGPNDRAAIITFGETSSLDQRLTRDRRAWIAAVDRAQATGTATAFLDAVYWSITQVALRPLSGSLISAGVGRPEARRLVLALTDGNDNNSRIFPQRLIEYARANGVSLCMAALGEDAATTDMLFLAQQTEGVYLRAPTPQDLQRLYVSLAEQLRREYRVTIQSPRPTADGTRRELHVALEGYPLDADAWYQAPGQGSLLVTVPGSPAGPEVASAAAAGPAGLDRALLVGALLMVGGLSSTLVVVLWWLSSRQRRLPIVDSNPRLDLLPLWVRQGSTRVGRGIECELVLDSQQVSRVHARIEGVHGVFQIVDEGSRNGTYVNGRRVRRSRALQVGDIVRFGDREFRFAGEL